MIYPTALITEGLAIASPLLKTMATSISPAAVHRKIKGRTPGSPMQAWYGIMSFLDQIKPLGPAF